MKVQDLINLLQKFDLDADMFATWEGVVRSFDLYEAADGQIVVDADNNMYQCMWQETPCSVCGKRANGRPNNGPPVCYAHWGEVSPLGRRFFT